MPLHKLPQSSAAIAVTSGVKRTLEGPPGQVGRSKKDKIAISLPLYF